MSSFAVRLTRIRTIEPIPNADAIELAVIGDYRSVVRKGDFSEKEMVVYIPEQALVPAWLLKSMGLEGKLAGPEKNRVKAAKFRGCLSQGLCLAVRQLKATTASMVIDEVGNTAVFKEGEDVAPMLGIEKYEPYVPQNFAGELYAAFDFTLHYDIENFKTYPDILQEGEEVIFTEKLHGSFCGVGIVPPSGASEKHWMDRVVVFSKGLGAQGLCLLSCENNTKSNAYIQALQRLDVFNKLMSLEASFKIEQPWFFLGEVYGPGIQDNTFTYGHKETSFRVFDVAVGFRGHQHFLDYTAQTFLVNGAGLDQVPLLYRGPFSRDAMVRHTSGKETVSGNNAHMREGIVIKPVEERSHNELGRVILKSVSAEYLLRKGGTEYN